MVPMNDLSRPVAASAAPRALPIGTRVGDFEIVRLLAETALSIVYLATDRSGAEVVVKEFMPQQRARRERGAMLPATPADAEPLVEGLRAFIAEGHLLAQFDQPSLVHVQQLVEANATAYHVMPQHGGARLLDVRHGMRVPPDETALRLLLDGLLDALHPLHEHGRLHGAVNPTNILLLAEGKPLLLGPELARAAVASGLVESLMAIVEPSFAAPEQVRPSASQAIGPWTDLYSVAETLRFCVSGELPPPADSPLGGGRSETMKEMLQRRFSALPAVRYSAPLLTVLDAALDPNTGARPQSVAEFHAALETIPPASRNDAWISGVPPHSGSAPESRAEPLFDLRRPLPAADPTSQTVRPPAPAMQRPIVPPHPPWMPPDSERPAPEPGMQRATVPPHAPWIPPDPEPPAPPRATHRVLWIGGGLLLLAAAAAGGWWSREILPTALPSSDVMAAAPTAPERANGAAAPAPAPEPLPSAAPSPAPPVVSALPSDSAPNQASAPEVVAPTPAPTPPVSIATSPAPAEPPAHPPNPARPPAKLATKAPVERTNPGPTNPRDACGDRTQFALYRCVQALCAQKGWSLHPQCVHLRETDRVD